jgi:hypothetical protein
MQGTNTKKVAKLATLSSLLLAGGGLLTAQAQEVLPFPP